jgi:hypothetical protein
VNIAAGRGKGEGDGIDSNGWLVINGGSLMAAACSTSQDSGIDSEMGIYLNGGTVIATGAMLDAIAGGSQYKTFSFQSKVSAGAVCTVTGSDGGEILTFDAVNDFTLGLVRADGVDDGAAIATGEQNASSGGRGGKGGFGGMAPPDFDGAVPPDHGGQAMPGIPGSGDERPVEPKDPELPDGAAPPAPPEWNGSDDTGPVTDGAVGT